MTLFSRRGIPISGELAAAEWFSEFDPDDQAEAVAEIRTAAALTLATADPAPLREVLCAWATTASVMRDSVRRAVHTAPGSATDYVEVSAVQQ